MYLQLLQCLAIAVLQMSLFIKLTSLSGVTQLVIILIIYQLFILINGN